jgi:hypothetical protein
MEIAEAMARVMGTKIGINSFSELRIQPGSCLEAVAFTMRNYSELKLSHEGERRRPSVFAYLLDKDGEMEREYEEHQKFVHGKLALWESPIYFNDRDSVRRAGIRHFNHGRHQFDTDIGDHTVYRAFLLRNVRPEEKAALKQLREDGACFLVFGASWADQPEPHY